MSELVTGYGNIAPKTSAGQMVTMGYAVVGVPLFLMWVSQMGTFLAQTFQFLYAHVCCVVCINGRRRRAAREAARAQKRARAQQLQV